MALAAKTKRKPTSQVKKRAGQHHKKNKNYLKSYWPYLPMLAVIGIGMLTNMTLVKSSVLGASSDFSSNTLLDDTNRDRVQANENPLTIDPELTSAAQAKANDLVTKDYWAHNSPDGKNTPWTFITASGYQYQQAGENLAYGFPDANSAMTGWMNSPEHKANILNSEYKNVGFATASSPNYQGKGPQTVVVAEYGNPVDAAATISFTVPPPTGVAGAADVKQAPVEVASQPVSRVELLAGNHADWMVFAVTLIASGAAAAFIIRHGLAFKRLFAEGETFVIHHPYIDIGLVMLVTAGAILTRTTGFIR